MVRPPCQGFVTLVFQLVSLVFLLVGWCVRLPEVLSPLVSQLLSQLVFLLVSLCWMVRPPSQGLVSQLVFLLVSLCWMVRPPSGWCVCLPEALSPSLSSSFSPRLFPILSSSLSPSLSSFLIFLFPLVGWCIRLGFVSLLSLSSCFPLLDDVSTFPKPCLPCLQACLPSCFPLFLNTQCCDKASEAENNKRDVVSTYCRHYRDSCGCYFMCLTCSSKHFSTHCFGSTVV